jgi:hypothetical protein
MGRGWRKSHFAASDVLAPIQRGAEQQPQACVTRNEVIFGSCVWHRFVNVLKLVQDDGELHKLCDRADVRGALRLLDDLVVSLLQRDREAHGLALAREPVVS